MIISNGRINKREKELNKVFKAFNIQSKYRKVSLRRYKALYEKTRRQLRNYEKLTGAKQQSASSFIKNQARWRETLKKEGKPYQPRLDSKFIQSLPSGKLKVSDKELQETTKKYIDEKLGKFIENNKYAQMIHDKYKGNPTKELKALTIYLQGRRDIQESRKGEVKTGDVIKRGEAGGSNEDYDQDAYNDAIDFTED